MPLPNFFIIGFAHCGTTSLYHYLRQHPQIFLPELKEPHYFSQSQQSAAMNRYEVQSFAEYQKLFQKVDAELAIGEASTSYARSSTAPHKIEELIPEAKIIVMLRHPVDQAYSNYLMQQRFHKNNQPPSPEDFLRQYSAHPDFFYLRALKRYYQVFPKEQIKVVISEQFFSQTETQLQEICSFLNVDPHFSFDTQVQYNRGRVSKAHWLEALLYNKATQQLKVSLKAKLPSRQLNFLYALLYNNISKADKIDSKDKQEIIQSFQTDIRTLEQLLNHDFSIWWNKDV